MEYNEYNAQPIDALTHDEYDKLLSQAHIPEVHQAFYRSHKLFYFGIGVQERAADLELVEGCTRYNYTRSCLFSALGGAQSLRLQQVYALLINAPDNKGKEHDWVGCPEWFYKVMQLVQVTERPMLWGMDLRVVPTDHIFLGVKH